MAHAIVEGDGLALGTPSVSDDREMLTIPILRMGRRARAYVLAAEVFDQVSAVDPGRIDRLRVHNESARVVFLPPGSLFESSETASRATTVGVVLNPRSTVELDVRCVHASQSIGAGADLRLSKPMAPYRVRRALLSRDQGLVWSTVRDVVSSRHGPSDASDDLVAALDNASPGDRENAAWARAAALETERCGDIVLDVQGVVVVEVFDSPESWTAVAGQEMERREGPHLSRHNLMPARPLSFEEAVRTAKEFLLHLAETGHRQATEHSWTAIDSSSEYTVLGGDVVHLIAFGGGDPWTGEASVSRTVNGSNVGEGFLPSFDPMVDVPSAEGDVAVAQVVTADADEEPVAPMPSDRPRPRKVLTSGWDAPTFQSLEHYSRKEFGGDRSAAMRFLVRQGLRRRGYMGPRPPPTPVAFAAAPPSEEDAPRLEVGRPAAEARIRDFERIARTDTYAEWLRVRARRELERMASASVEGTLRESARSALERLPVSPSPEEPEELLPEEAVPVPPPVDVRPLLRRAFAASAAGQYSDSLRFLDEVLETEPDNRTALLGRAVALRRSGKTQEALFALDRVLRLEPANAAALLNRGRVLQEMGDLPGALETYDRLAAVAPNDWDVWVARGDVLARMGRVHDALAAYSEALRRNPEDESLNAKIRGLERTRPPPPPSPAARAALPREIQEGQSYLVKEPRPDLSHRMLRSLALRSVPCLVVGPHTPAQVRADRALASASVLQLTHEPAEARAAPTSLAYLTSALERFVIENHGRAAILLEGLTLLVEDNGFRETALFIERVNESILPSHAIFLVSVAPGDLEDKEAAILERDLRVLS